MRTRLPEVICPKCGVTGKMSIGTRLQAKPIGSFSLSGAGLKVICDQVPVLVCWEVDCDYELVGRFEGGDAVFGTH